MNRDKIVIDLPPGVASTAELLWGKSVGPDQYELENVPIWAYGLAYGDIIETRRGADGRRHFERVLKPSGLLTVRAAGPTADREKFSELIELLQRHAVATERYSASYAAFAMEPAAFAEIEPIVDDAARGDDIHVEVANDD